MTDITFHAFFNDQTGVGVASLTPTINIYRVSRAGGAGTLLVNGAATTETVGAGSGGGFYQYRLTGADLGLYDYKAKFITASALVQAKEVPALWVDFSIQTWDEILTGATHNIPTSAGRRLRQIASNVTIDGTVVSSTDNTVVLDAGASAVNGAYDPSLIVIVTGAGAGQSRLIFQYIGASRTCIVDRNWKVNPVAGDEYVIFGDVGREHVNEGLAQGGGVQTITLNALASSFDDVYNGQGIFLRSGTGEDQYRRITDYDGISKVAIVSRPWSVVPDITTAYVVLPTGSISDECLASAIWNASMASYMTPGTTGETLAYNYIQGAIEFTYTVTNPALVPIAGASVWITTDLAGANVVWRGETDTFGIARDVLNRKPWLDAGTYYFWVQHANYSGPIPDTEIVS